MEIISSYTCKDAMSKTYWVIVDEDGPWLMEDMPDDMAEIMIETNDLVRAENVLTRACQLYEPDNSNL